MLPLLENKVVFVSGGTQGLGAAIARAAAREGAEAVVVTGRRAEHGEKVVAELAERGATPASCRPTSATSRQAQAAVATTVDEFGRIDCLVNCGRPDRPRHAAGHHPGAVRPAHRGQPARPVLPDAGGDRAT